MASVPVPITVDGDTYKVPGADTIEPLAVSVSYDGTNAGGTFLPCLSYYTQAGQLISRTFPATAVAAGESAEVSFIPFVPPASGGSGGSGIQFNTDNQGGYLDVTTNDPDGLGVGMQLTDQGGGGILISEVGSDPITVASTAGAINLELNLFDTYVNLKADGTSEYRSEGNMLIRGDSDVTIKLGGVAANSLTVLNNAGSPILRVTEDATYHIKTGKVWVADL